MSYATDDLLRAAADGLRSGNLAWAESLSRLALEQRPGDAQATAMIAEVGRFLTQLAQDAGPPSPGERFIVIKAWGYGFWSDVDHVLGSLLLAEITGRTPVIHWGANSLYTDDPTANAWNCFFEPISQIAIADLMRPGLSYFPPKWNATNLNQGEIDKFLGQYSRMAAIYLLQRPESVIVSDFHAAVYGLAPWIPLISPTPSPPTSPLHNKPPPELYRYLTAKYIKPLPAITAEVDRFYEKHLVGRPFVAVHYRGGDKHREDKHVHETNARYFDHVDRIPADWRIFLLTDAADAVHEFRQRYGDRLVLADAERSADQQGVHRKASANKVRRGVEVMIDTYLAARANHFIGNGGSNVSCMILNLRPWKDSDVTLLAPNGVLRHRPFLFKPR